MNNLFYIYIISLFLFLIGLFAGISCYLIMLGLSFIGLSYLIVYTGAISKLSYYIKKYPRFFILFTSVITASIITFSIRFLILYLHGIDVFTTLSTYPELAFFVIFIHNISKFGLKYYLTNYFDQLNSTSFLVNSFDNVDRSSSPGPSNPAGSGPSNSTGSRPNNPVSSESSNPIGPRPAANQELLPQVVNNSFTRGADGRYIVNDPTDIKGRGFFDDSGRPYRTHQPFLSNLSDALGDYSFRSNKPTVGWDTTAFSQEDYNYWVTYMNHQYPYRDHNQLWNSKPVRSDMRKRN